jgi:c-di-GMP-binding flagellar brake protein YcgR
VLEGRSEDVSTGGLLVLAPQAFEQAATVQVRFALPTTGQVVELQATARWVKAARATGAVGLQFISLPDTARDVIDRYVVMMGGE